MIAMENMGGNSVPKKLLHNTNELVILVFITIYKLLTCDLVFSMLIIGEIGCVIVQTDIEVNFSFY